MTHATVDIILREHRALSAMLRAILLLLGEHRRRNTVPDLSALQAMLFYIGEFPEKLHHPKESQLLFPRLRGRDGQLDEVLDRLDRDHANGERALRELEHALLGIQVLRETTGRNAGWEAFEAAMRQYVGSYLEHMHVEEAEILPRAEAALGEADWAELDAAFSANRDPLTGCEADEAYRPLFRKIVSALEKSGGVGSALEAFAGASQPKFADHRPDGRH
ncbi:hemerythrin domain-containing protein [Variovorax sp. J22P271]|uniref:hemerythrin domain-containing protein n=1 Tax=Variovorax davisae TaxID=3053515 RepID=UPI0025760AC6|nr:hemerythrin domain-containing protein [Variovorax sp. J22P271]MDM0031100.1 hemerythrin domain-containing protein [Variovorax sp. J22P271]